MDAYEELANEIVLSAVEDYRKGRKLLKEDLGNTKAIPMMLSALSFIRSDWYRFLTELDGEMVIKHIQGESCDGNTSIKSGDYL